MAVFEYPDYYEKFSCIGGVCKDSCCAGWEVDVDNDSAEMYKNVPLPIGDRLRKELYKDNEGYKFHLTATKRCPFLNDENLCDLIIAMGEGALCVTCTEYPRYFCDGPEYEQVDLTLSCPEAVRLFYSTEEPISYVTYEEALHDSDWEEDPFDEDPFEDEDEDEWEEDESWDEEDGFEEEEEFPEEEEEYDEDAPDEIQYEEADYARLEKTLALRNQAIALLQDRSKPLEERFLDVEALFPRVEMDSDEDLLRRMDGMEHVNPLWDEIKTRIESRLPETESKIPELIAAGGSGFENRMERFATYLMYRYTFDYYYFEDMTRPIRFVKRCYRMLMLLFADWCLESGSDVIPIPDLEDRTRIFSRQVEHSKGNVDLFIKP